MYGKDIERILAKLEKLKITSYEAIIKYQGWILNTWGTPDPMPDEIIDTIINPVVKPALTSEFSSMKTLKSLVYSGANSFNNSIGSPWTELEHLESVWKAADIWWPDHLLQVPQEEKVVMLSHLHCIYTAVCDCKAPLIIYHHTIQQGWDHNMNGNNPSISWNDDLNGRKTIGLGTQTYGGQVGIPGKSKNPY